MARVLIVDDEKGIRVTLREFVLMDGHEVETAETSEQALALCDQKPFDVVVTDIILPKESGVQLLKHLRERHPDSLVILITGEPTVETVTRALRAGAFDYLPKPITGRAIRSVVNGAAKVKALSDENRRLQEENDRYREHLEQLVEERSKKLMESERRYRLLFNAGHEGILVFRLDADHKPGRIVEVSDFVCQRTGRTREELLRMSVKELTTPDAWERMPTIDVFRASPRHIFETVGVEGSGRVYPMQVFASLFDLDGEPAVLSITRDISELKALEADKERLKERLALAQRMEAMGRLAEGVAHDFNDLLTGIMGGAEILLGTLSKEDPLRTEAEEIQRAADRAALLTAQLIAFSQRQPVSLRPLDLNEILSASRRMLGRIAGEEVELLIRFGERLPPIVGDRTLVTQALVNLVLFTRDTMPGGGRLLFETEATHAVRPGWASDAPAPTDAFVRLSVTDSGPGLDESSLVHIFEPFAQGRGRGFGSGLGLSLIYSILKRSHGEVEARSTPGQGTTFDLYFPVATGLPEPASGPSARAGRSQGNEIVLVHGEEAMVRRMVTKLLRQSGYRVIVAETHEEALRFVSAAGEPPRAADLTLLDVQPPGRTEADLVRELSRRQPTRPILLMVSGEGDLPAPIPSLLSDPATPWAVLSKPFPLERLANTVRDLLGRSAFEEGPLE